MTPEQSLQEFQLHIQRVERELRVTRERFQLALDSIPHSIFWKDRNSRFLGCNKKFAEDAGLTVEQVVGRTDYELPWKPHEVEKYRRDDQRLMADGRGEYGMVETQLQSDGVTYYVETNKVPLRDPDGQVIGILGTYADITPRIELEHELRRHRDQLEELVIERTRKLEIEIAERQAAQHLLAERAQELDAANQALTTAEQAKSEFFANVSHELRTPLTLILAPVEAALAGRVGPLDEGMRRTLGTIHNSAVRLLELVNAILDMARVEAGQLRANPVPCDVRQLFESVLNDFLPLAEKQEQTVLWSCHGEGPRLLDCYLFERILFNLISNAVKFTPVGGRIEVTCTLDETDLLVRVRDNGIGISEEDQQKLFRKFYQVESSSTRRYAGTGLGLAMVKDFAAMLGGEVSVSSRPGEGSEFSVRLPAAQTDEEAGPCSPVRAAAMPAGTQPKGSRCCWPRGEMQAPVVLIAEDNEELACFLGDLLAEQACVHWAPDGQAALERAAEIRPELVVTDVMMPRRNGVSLCRELKQGSQEEPPAVLLLTAQADRGVLLDGWDAGADDFLHKPFHPLELTVRVRTLLQNRRKRLEADLQRKRLEEQLYHAQKVESLGVMAGGIAHDFNNLLMVVSGQLELVDYMGEIPEGVRECVDEAAEATRRAAALSRQMLTYVGQVPTKMERQNLAKLVAETAGMLERSLLPKPEFVMRLDPASVMGDSTQLSQIALNLITNAAESVPTERRARISVETGVRWFEGDPLTDLRAGEYAYLKVEDNGGGMDAAVLKRIWDPFYSTKSTGRGLGLASVQGILKAHQGTCRVESVAGQGTVFLVLLPPAADLSRPKEAKPAPAAPKPLLLVIDDQPQVRHVATRMLRVAGYEVISAETGQQALERLEQHPEVRGALVDVLLPDTDGRQLVREMQHIRPNLVCLLCSGYQGEVQAEPGQNVLPKPFRFEELKSRMETLLNTSSAV